MGLFPFWGFSAGDLAMILQVTGSGPSRQPAEFHRPQDPHPVVGMQLGGPNRIKPLKFREKGVRGNAVEFLAQCAVFRQIVRETLTKKGPQVQPRSTNDDRQGTPGLDLRHDIPRQGRIPAGIELVTPGHDINHMVWKLGHFCGNRLCSADIKPAIYLNRIATDDLGFHSPFITQAPGQLQGEIALAAGGGSGDGDPHHRSNQPAICDVSHHRKTRRP